MQLNGKAIRALKPREKPYKVTGGRGLHLYVTTLGSRLWPGLGADAALPGR
jgi:hypothetical protein